MKINKALITAAGPDQRNLPLQILIDKNRNKKSVLEILIEEILSAGIKEIGVVVQPTDIENFEKALGTKKNNITFIPQSNPRGYGHALLAGSSFLNDEAFLHLVGDHLYLSREGENIARRVIELAQNNKCSVSTVQATRENSIMNFGTIGAMRIQGKKQLFQINQVKEKPTPTYAEQYLMIPGLRAGYYLCFFGMHVFTPLILELLRKNSSNNPNSNLGLSESLDELSKHSKYLALEMNNQRYDLGQDYGLLKAQLAISLSGKDRDLILSELTQFFIDREKYNNDLG